MTVKLLALYKKPADEDAFFEHYNEVHLPIVATIPGLKKTVITRITGSPMGGEPEYFLMAEMHFSDKESFDKAMSSPENRAAGKDAMSFAKGQFILLVGED